MGLWRTCAMPAASHSWCIRSLVSAVSPTTTGLARLPSLWISSHSWTPLITGMQISVSTRSNGSVRYISSAFAPESTVTTLSTPIRSSIFETTFRFTSVSSTRRMRVFLTCAPVAACPTTALSWLDMMALDTNDAPPSLPCSIKGRLKEKHDPPAPLQLVAQICPPIRSMNFTQRFRPRPVPLGCATDCPPMIDAFLAICANLEKRSFAKPPTMPSPQSITEITATRSSLSRMPFFPATATAPSMALRISDTDCTDTSRVTVL
mmetsp:Transcript_22084/g.55419  ORF Transcript_22084/g.55419 Transcript_22084/m.55419 type:complete len:263 (+) Transcript_22084:169-957(+)